MQVENEVQERTNRNILILEQADAYQQMLQSKGWKFYEKSIVEWLEAKRQEARKMGSANHCAAIYAWQAAEDLIESQWREINYVLHQADDIRGSVPLEFAAILEKNKNEHSEPGDTADPTGY